MFSAGFDSPLGWVTVWGDDRGIARITCTEAPADVISGVLPAPVRAGVDQLQAYFAGNLTAFDLVLNPAGTDFQQRVWKALLDVPFGQTRSYLSLSRTLGDEKAIRAVAAANGKNPLWIVVPCHRIIGSDGSLTGYAGGLWRKQWLLNHEQKSGQLSLF